MKAALILALSLLLAGCGESGREDAGPSPDDAQGIGLASPSDDQGGGPEVPSEPPLNASSPAPLSWDGCVAWDAIRSGPAQAVPEFPTPPGWAWSDSLQDPLAGVTVLGVRCERVSFGALERGPMTLLLDTHSKAHVPSNCMTHADTLTVHAVLGTLYLDDADLATQLAQAYGLPTAVVEFGEEVQELGAAKARHATWGAPGGVPSEMVLFDDGTETPARTIYRNYWVHGDRLVRWQIDVDLPLPVVGTRLGTGSMHVPMMMAQMGEQFVGTADWYPSFESTNTFTVYDDFGCEGPREG